MGFQGYQVKDSARKGWYPFSDARVDETMGEDDRLPCDAIYLYDLDHIYDRVEMQERRLNTVVIMLMCATFAGFGIILWVCTEAVLYIWRHDVRLQSMVSTNS